jgi:hypothetical protein
METAVFLLTIVCYGIAIYLWWLRDTPIFLLTLLAGHLGAFASPLRPLLYGVSYAPDLDVLYSIQGISLLWPVLIASAWFYAIPVLVVLSLHLSQVRVTSYALGVVTYIVFFGYHFLLERIGVSWHLWSYHTDVGLPFGLSHTIVSALMSAAISFGLLYILLSISHHSRISMLFEVLPSIIGLNFFVRGLIGAPFWIAMKLDVHSQEWIVAVGLVSALALLLYGVHTVAAGMSRVHQEIMV